MNNLKKSALVACMTCAMAIPGIASAHEDRAKENLVKASTILSSSISNGHNVFGQVDNLLLGQDGKAVEYVFFNTNDTFRATSGQKGFIELDNVDFRPGAFGNTQVVVQDTDAQRKPEELKVSYSQAQHHLLSNLLDESIQFSDKKLRKIDDILLHPRTGEIKYFTVEMDVGGFFDEDTRLIPATEVNIKQSGLVTTSAKLSDVTRDNKYKPDAI